MLMICGDWRNSRRSGACGKAGGEVVGLTFLVELTFLGGRERLARYPVSSLLTYDR